MKMKKVTAFICTVAMAVSVMFPITSVNAVGSQNYANDYEAEDAALPECIVTAGSSHNFEIKQDSETNNKYMAFNQDWSFHAYKLSEPITIGNHPGDASVNKDDREISVKFDFLVNRVNEAQFLPRIDLADTVSNNYNTNPSTRDGQFRLFSINSANKFYMAGESGNANTLGFTGAEDAAIELGKWYSYELTFKSNSRNLNLTITKKDDPTQTMVAENKWVADGGGGIPTYARAVDSLVFCGYGYMEIDNISITRGVKRPTINDSKVTFHTSDGSEIACTKDAVSRTASSIQLDFGEAMSDAVENQITLLGADNSGVSYTVDVNDNIVTLSGLDLEYEKSYVLKVSGSAASKFGDAIGSDFVYEFTVAPKATSVSFISKNFEDNPPVYPENVVGGGNTFSTLTDETTGNKYMRANTVWHFNKYALNETIATGSLSDGKKYTISFDFRCSDKTSSKNRSRLDLAVTSDSTYLTSPTTRSNQLNFLRVEESNHITIGGNADAWNPAAMDMGEIVKDKWYSYKMTFNPKTRVADITITQHDDPTIVLKVENGRINGGADGGLYDNVKYDSVVFTGAGIMDIDNLKIEREIKAPTLTDASVLFQKADGTALTTSKNAVSPLAKTIVLDFGEQMSESAKNGITLTDAEGNAVGFNAAVSGNSIVLSNVAISENKSYTLKVAAGVESLYDDALTDEFVYEFTVAAKKAEMKLDVLLIDGNPVTNISGLADGNTTLKINASNTTDETKVAVVVLAYYGANGELLGTTAADCTVESGFMSDKYVTITVAKPTGTTAAQIMLLDSLSSLKPLSGALKF